MAASFRVVAGPTAFTDKTEHQFTLTDTVAAGETLVALIACSVTDINGIVGYVDSNDGVHTAQPDCATQLSWQKDEELGAAGGGGYIGLSCFSSYIPNGIASGATIRFGVKFGAGGTFDPSGFYHGQSPYGLIVALNSGDGRAMVFDVGDSVAVSATTTPTSPSITTANEAIVLGLFGGSVQAGADWFTPGSGWTTELADTAAGTESSYNIAAQGRIATTSFTGTSNGTSAANKQFGTLIVSYKATSTAQTPGPTLLAGTRETDLAGPGDFFANGNTAAFPFVAVASGTSARMGGRFSADNPSITTVKLGIYSHDAGNNRPLTLLGSGSVSVNPVNMVPFGAVVSGVNIVAGTTYWLAYSGAGEQVDINGVSSTNFGREGTGNMVSTWVAGGNMQVKPGIWIETSDPGPPAPAVTFPTAPRPRAFQEQGRIYSGEQTGFQPRAFQIPDPGRAFQEGTRFGERRAFQDQAFQLPDPVPAFQPEAFWVNSGFQMPVVAFQEDSGFQGDAFQEWFKQAGAVGPSLTTLDSVGNIASGEAFGNATRVQFVVATIGIASSEAFGNTRVQRVVKQAGAIASAEAFGTPKVVRIVGPTGIASSEAFGRPTLVTSIIRGAGAIPSAEAFGTTHVLFVVKPIGIVSTQAFGTTRVLSPQYVSAAGAITSAEAFGQATRVIRIVGRVGGVASAEAFGRPTLVTSIIRSAGGIPSAESFGQADRVIRIVGRVGAIASSEAFGVPQTSSGVYFVTGVGAIPSAEAFGQATHVLFIVRGIGIASAQAFGTAQIPRLLRLTTGISSAEAFGPSTKVRRVVGTLGIASTEAFGTPTKNPQVVFVHPGIASSETWGRPTVFDATIQTASAFGKVYLSDVAVFRLVVVDDALYGGRISDNRTFAGVIDDTSGG